MGIGNPASSTATRPDRMTHYPSWGSGTRAVSPIPSAASSSLPLMGIGNFHSSGFLATSISSHYPSWGSGTFHRPETRSEAPELTTPHGDRERAYRRRESAGRRVSLPLMGIGNQAPARVQRLAEDSLPLMGIGNGCAGNDARRRWGLTTPHGDREPAQRAERVDPNEELTTPHGDREPGVSRARKFPPDAHYPSWGSGTGRGCVHRRRRIRLTTPHGDREPSPTPASRLAASLTHYPSWGSGTLLTLRRFPP